MHRPAWRTELETLLPGRVLDAPAAHVTARAVDDVVAMLQVAQRNSVPVRVGAAQNATSHAGIQLSLRALDAIDIDVVTRIATVGAGVTWSSLLQASAARGLSAIPGIELEKHVVGDLLDGAFGPLLRSHGACSDAALGFRVVLASGDVVDANTEAHPELFWALRGGHGGFGVVVEARLRLASLRSVYGGSIVFDAPHVEHVLAGWLAWTATAHPRLSTSVVVTRAPHRLSLRCAFPDGVDEGARLTAPLRALAPALTDSLLPLAVPDIGRIHEPAHRAPRAHIALRLADPSMTAALTALIDDVTSIELRHRGGAAAKDVPEGSAVGGRDAAFEVLVAGAGPETVAALRNALAPHVLADARPAEVESRLARARLAFDTHRLFVARPT